MLADRPEAVLVASGRDEDESHLLLELKAMVSRLETEDLVIHTRIANLEKAVAPRVFVRNSKSGAVHKIRVMNYPVSPMLWTSYCGWQFGAMGYELPEPLSEFPWRSICDRCLPAERAATRAGAVRNRATRWRRRWQWHSCTTRCAPRRAPRSERARDTVPPTQAPEGAM